MSVFSFAFRHYFPTLAIFACFIVIESPESDFAYSPTIKFPEINIQIRYLNPRSTQIKENIITPVDDALGTISGIVPTRSISTADKMEIDMEFERPTERNVIARETMSISSLYSYAIPVQDGWS